MPKDIACCQACGRPYEQHSEPPCGHSQMPSPESPLGQLIAAFRAKTPSLRARAEAQEER